MLAGGRVEITVMERLRADERAFSVFYLDRV
jgi:hypothetical protein